jgi:hypothetical protein
MKTKQFTVGILYRKHKKRAKKVFRTEVEIKLDKEKASQ